MKKDDSAHFCLLLVSVDLSKRLRKFKSFFHFYIPFSSRLRPPATGDGAGGKLKSNNVGHLNTTLELHEEDVMWKAGGRQ